MNVAVAYSWIKAVHVASAMAFVGGVLAQSLFLAAVGTDAAQEAIRRFGIVERSITAPALFAALAGGMALAALGSWFPQRWLIAKLVLVVGLLGIHGLQSGRLRRLAQGRTIASRALQYAVLAFVTLISGLAVLKPDLF